MKHLKLFEELNKYGDDAPNEFVEIGDNINEILYDISDNGKIYLQDAMYNKRLHGKGGLMIEIVSNPNNEVRSGDGNVWVEGYDYFIITEDIVESLKRCIDYINQVNTNGEKKYDINFNIYDGFLGRDIDFDLDKLVGKKPSFIGITIT